jgi:Fe-S-cluster containining protein
MSELKSAFSPLFNESGFEAQIDWNLSRREFAKNLERLFENLQKHHAAIPLPIAADIGPVTCLLAGIDCKGCSGVCCTRGSQNVLLSQSEAIKLGIKGNPDNQGQILLPLPCKFFKKGQCSIYSDRPAACRLYPVQAGGSRKGASGQEVIIGLDSYCPESSHIGLRVYLTAYDLAHTTNKTI